MADLFKAAVLQVLTPDCYDQYFVNFNFFHVNGKYGETGHRDKVQVAVRLDRLSQLDGVFLRPVIPFQRERLSRSRYIDCECLKSTISKVLGLAIVAGSVTVKIPQVLKIYKSKSGKGISELGVFLDLSAITSFFLYSYLKNFPFSAWGDGLFLAIQTAAILGLILYYKKRTTQLGLFLASYVAVIVLLVVGIIPLSFLWFLQILNLPIVIAGKGTQALANYRSRSTGQLSALTCWMLFGGSVARIFTSIQETGDATIILTFVTTTILNGIIVFQLLYYAKPSQKKSKKDKGKSKGKKSD